MTLYAENMKKLCPGLFGEDKKAMKKIKKAQRLPEYQGAVRELSVLWQKNEFAGKKLK